MPLNSVETRYLMAHLVRCDKVIQQALTVLRPSDFNDELEQPYAVLWAVSMDWYKSTGKPIPKTLAVAEIDKRIAEASPDWMTPELYEDTLKLVEEIYALNPDTDFYPEMAINTWLQTVLNEKKVLPKFHAFDGDNLPEAIKELSNAFASTRVSAASGTDIFDMSAPDAYVVNAKRNPTGCNVFDKITGGGLRDKELVGILGPTSGGKTTLAVQIAVEMARLNKRVAFFSYEQPITPEIRDRMWSCATRISRTKIEEIPRDKLEPEVTAALLESEKYLKPYMRAFDMQRNDVGFGGMDEVEAIIQREIASGRPPKCIIIDWVSLMARRYMAANKLREDAIRGVILGMCGQAKSLAVRYECSVILCQQLSGEAGTKTNVRAKTSHYDALDCKTFSVQMDFCVVIGPKDPKNNNCILRTTKARSVGNGEQAAKLVGEFNRFDTIDGEYVEDRNGDGRFLEKSELGDDLDSDYTN